MPARIRKVTGGLTAAALLGALGFGATQLFATPAEAGLEAACTSYTCGTACFKKGYTHWACWNGNCQCSYGPPK